MGRTHQPHHQRPEQMQLTISLGRYDSTLGTASIESDLGDGRMFRMELDLRQPSQRYIYECHTIAGFYEPETVAIIREHLKPGDVFFDVGAHVGYFSRLALDLGALVVACEPSPENLIYLRRNIPHESVFPGAIGAKADTGIFYKNCDNDGGNALWPPGLHPWNMETREANSPCAKVNITPLDQFTHLGFLPTPTIIKIDTEGAECEVLKGAEAILAQPQLKLVICELNHFGLAQMGGSEAEMRAIMARHGFSAPVVNAEKDVANLFFTRK